jgi:hypothetical protein
MFSFIRRTSSKRTRRRVPTNRKLLLFKQLNKERARHIQEISGLLCRKLGVLRDDRDRSSRCHILENSLEKFHSSRGQLDCLFLAGTAGTQRQRLPATRQWGKPCAASTPLIRGVPRSFSSQQ